MHPTRLSEIVVRVAVSLWAVSLPVVMSFLVVVFFGLNPARQAARVDPIEAFRHE